MQRVLRPLQRQAARLLRSLALPAPESSARLRRILLVERNVVLPVKLLLIAGLFVSLQTSPWFGIPLGSLEVTVTAVTTFFSIYSGLNLLGALVLLGARRLPFPLVQWAVFALNLVDGLFIAALTLVGGGYDSSLFWVFVLLLLRNAAAHPPVWSQLVLNLAVSLCFGLAGFLDAEVTRQVEAELVASARPFGTVAGQTNALPPIESWADIQFRTDEPNPAENAALRLVVLALASVCLYAMQVLIEKQRLVAAVATESARREGQLRSAGRLAAEFAHQLKNPLAIINNATFSLQRSLATGKGDPRQQLGIITEEIERADRIITQVMGYGQLTEGRVERLDLAAEIEQARALALPPGIGLNIRFHADLRGPFPPLLMQRRHLAEIFVNLFQNAREAMNGAGQLTVTARAQADDAIEVTVADDGPGIPPDQLGRVFESYFTTKPRGTGLGLAIVRNNVELYGGTVRAESELGKGARFVLSFPAKTASEPAA